MYPSKKNKKKLGMDFGDVNFFWQALINCLSFFFWGGGASIFLFLWSIKPDSIALCISHVLSNTKRQAYFDEQRAFCFVKHIHNVCKFDSDSAAAPKWGGACKRSFHRLWGGHYLNHSSFSQPTTFVVVVAAAAAVTNVGRLLTLFFFFITACFFRFSNFLNLRTETVRTLLYIYVYIYIYIWIHTLFYFNLFFLMPKWFLTYLY